MHTFVRHDRERFRNYFLSGSDTSDSYEQGHQNSVSTLHNKSCYGFYELIQIPIVRSTRDVPSVRADRKPAQKKEFTPS